MLILLVVVGVAYCAFALARGVWNICAAGRRAAVDGLKHANRELRDQVGRPAGRSSAARPLRVGRSGAKRGR